MTYLESLIIDVIDAYERAIGSVPIEMIHYHVNKKTKNTYTLDAIQTAAENLVQKGDLETRKSYTIKEG